jgi:predicted RNA binding protein YcfA (HicA-like mRNA interferase family)
VFTMPSHKLPVVSGEQLIKALQKLGYTVVRQRGTHIRLKKVADENSDVDLIVVGDEFKNKSPLKRPVELYLEWTMDYPVDFLWYTPEEFEEKRKEISIVRHAINEEIVI